MVLTKETQVIQAIERVYNNIMLVRGEINNLALTLESYCIDNFARKPMMDSGMDMDALDISLRFGKVKELLRYVESMKTKADCEIPSSPFSAHKSLEWLSDAMVSVHDFMREITTDFKKLDLEAIETKLREFRKGGK